VIADAVGIIRTPWGKPHAANVSVVRQALKEGVAVVGRFRPIGGAVDAGDQAARAACAVREGPAAAAPVLTNAALTSGVVAAGLTGASPADPAAIDACLAAVPHPVSAAGAGAVHTGQALAISIANAGRSYGAAPAARVAATAVAIGLRPIPLTVGAGLGPARPCLTQARRTLRVSAARAIDGARAAGAVAAIDGGLCAVPHAVVTGGRLAAALDALLAAVTLTHPALTVTAAPASAPHQASSAAATAIRRRLILIPHPIVAARSNAGSACTADVCRTVGVLVAACAERAPGAGSSAAVRQDLVAVQRPVLARADRTAPSLFGAEELGPTVSIRRARFAGAARLEARPSAVHAALLLVGDAIIASGWHAEPALAIE
jgi:hypothetical protein